MADQFISPDMYAAHEDARIHIKALEVNVAGLELSPLVASPIAVRALRAELAKLKWLISRATGVIE